MRINAEGLIVWCTVYDVLVQCERLNGHCSAVWTKTSTISGSAYEAYADGPNPRHYATVADYELARPSENDGYAVPVPNNDYVAPVTKNSTYDRAAAAAVDNPDYELARPSENDGYAVPVPNNDYAVPVTKNPNYDSAVPVLNDDLHFSDRLVGHATRRLQLTPVSDHGNKTAEFDGLSGFGHTDDSEYDL